MGRPAPKAAARSRWWIGGLGAFGLLSVAALAAATPPTSSGAMLTFHQQLRGARDALVFADLQSFRTWVAALADLDIGREAVPASQRSHAQRVRSLASKGKTARSMGEATSTLGKLAAQCGGCHTEAGKGPQYPPEPNAPQGPDLGDHMERHRWALDRLWEGLTAGYEKAWAAGAGQLREPALTQQELPESAHNPSVEGLAREMHALGKRAAKAKTPGERAQLVGKIVAVCGRCHAASGVRGL